MKGVFGWQIAAENSEYRMTFPKQLSQEPVSDDEIKALLKYVCDTVGEDSTADEIYHLIFIATSLDEDSEYIEPLDPFVFWPNKAQGLLAKNKARYRK